MTVIKGKKVILRDKRLEDAWNDYVWKNDLELTRLDASVPLDIPFSVYLLGYADELNRPDYAGRTLAIETLYGKHIGNCSYYHIDRAKGEAEVGILIGDQTCWNEGYGTDAVETLAEYLLNKEGFKRIYLHTLVRNIRAQKCFEKCGFVVVKRVLRGGYDFLQMEIAGGRTAPSGESTEASQSI